MTEESDSYDKRTVDRTDSPDPDDMEYIFTMGGPFDETLVAICVYSDDLDRHAVTKMLGVEPTDAWNAKEPHTVGKRKRTAIHDWGKWYLTTEYSTEPVGSKIKELLNRCTDDLDVWRQLSDKYRVCFEIHGRLLNWNRQLDLEPDMLRMLANRSVALAIDVYGPWGEDDEGEE
ncbi:DUF4279 domain-containing protein [Planctomycetota bacterium]